MRYVSIDVLRGVAILLMIQVHFVDNLSSREPPTAWLYDLSEVLGSLPAPMFTFVVGVSYCLWLRKQESLRRSDEEITKITVRRGLFLFGTGIAFNVLVWLPEDTFNWDILTLIGTALLLLALVRKVPPLIVVVLCLVVLFLSPVLREAFEYPRDWIDQTYDPDLTLQDVSTGFLANGFFPVFPWLIFPLVGFLVGDAVFPRPGRPEASPRLVWITGIGLLLLSVAGAVFGPNLSGPVGKHYLNGWSMFPASTGYVLAMLGLCLVSQVILHRWLDGNASPDRTGRVLTFLRRYSVFSLTVYLLHHAVFLWPLWCYGTLTQDDAIYYWRHAMSTPLALSLALAFIVACSYLLVFLERHGRPGFESLMRWICE